MTPAKRKDKDKANTGQIHARIILWLDGLRGAVAVTRTRENFPNLYNLQEEFVAATMVIVIVTIVSMGGMTKSIVAILLGYTHERR